MQLTSNNNNTDSNNNKTNPEKINCQINNISYNTPGLRTVDGMGFLPDLSTFDNKNTKWLTTITFYYYYYYY